METPFGPFEPTVELNDDATSRICRALVWLEKIMNMVGGFSIDFSEGQPLIVKTINGKRLEIPVFEAAELDAQQEYDDSLPSLQVPFRIDGVQQNLVGKTGLMIDTLTCALLMLQSMDSGIFELSWFKELFE